MHTPLLAIALLAACGSDVCIIPPCLAPMAVALTVGSSSTAGAISGAFVRSGGNTIPCAQTCFVPGGAGTYDLDVGAPGYQTVHRTVVVRGTTPECGCPSTETVQLSVALVPGVLRKKVSVA